MHFGNSIISYEQKEDIIQKVDKNVKVSPLKCDKKVSDSKSSFFRQIEITKKKSFGTESVFITNIYAYNIFLGKPNRTDKLNNLYACLSCLFAIWTKNSTFNLIKDLPWLHHTELLKTTDNVNILEKNVLSFSKTELRDIVKFANRFINILSNLMCVEPFSVLSNETIVLQSLYELKFMILSQESIAEKYKHFTVLEILVVINALQSFIITNCEDDVPLYKISPSEAKRVIFGYTINLNNLNEMESFLDKINDLGLETQQYCSIEDTLLVRLVINGNGENNTSKMSKEIGQTIITLKKQENMTIKEMISKAKSVSDIVKVNFYLENILYTIVKIINYKMKLHFQKFHAFNHQLIEDINDLVTKLEDSKMFPDEFLNYFYTLRELIPLSENPSEVSSKISTIYEKKFEKLIVQNLDPNYKVFQFVNDLFKYENNFMCSNDVFTFLRSTLSRHFTPYDMVTVDIKKIRSSVNQNENIKNGCRFIDTIYAVCIKIAINLKKYADLNENNDYKTAEILDSDEKYEMMKKYFLLATHKKTIKDDNFLKTAYNTAIILVNTSRSATVVFLENYQRPVYLIMTELNDYSIKYCSALHDRKGYMLYNNFDLDVVDKTEDVITESLNISPEELNQPLNYDHLDLRFLFTNYIKDSDVIKKYKDVIKFYWKGSARSLEEIYIYAQSTITLNPQFLYEFYDFFFKFYIAAFYFEIIQFYNDKKKPDATCASEYDLCVNNFSQDSFPDTMKPFIERLKEAARIPTYDYSDLRTYKVSFISRFQTEINNYFIFTPNSKINNSSSPSNNHKNCINNIHSINADLSKTVVKVLENYMFLHANYIGNLVVK